MKSVILLFAFLTFLPFLSSGQNYILVLNKSDHTAWQLDAETGKKVAEYATNTGPHEVAISPVQRKAAITNYGEQTPGSSITIIDLKKQVVDKVIEIFPYSRPHGIQWFKDGKRFIVSVEEQQAIAIVDVESGEVTKTIKTNEDVSHMVELSPDEKRVYVPNIGSGTLSVLDIPESTIIKTVETGAGAEGITLANKGSEVWISNRAGNTVSVINTKELRVHETLKSSSFPIRAKSSPNGQWVAVSNARSDEVAIFDANTKKLITEISTKPEDSGNGAPIGLIFSSDNSRLYVANSEADQIVVIDTGSWNVIDTFETGDTPDGIAFFTLSN